MYINLLTRSREELDTMKLKFVPRVGELIFSTQQDKYFTVINVIHHIYREKLLFFNYDRHVINLIVDEVSNLIIDGK